MKQIAKFLAAIVGIILLAYFVFQIRVLIVYIIISLVLTLMGTPLLKLLLKIRLGKKTMPNSLAALITLVVFISFFGGLISLFGPMISEQIQVISSLDIKSTGFEQLIESIESSMNQFHLSNDESMSNRAYIENSLEEFLNFSLLTNTLNQLLSMLGDIFIALFSILFISFFFLKEKNLVSKMIILLVPEKHLEKVKTIQKNTTKLLSRYFLGLVIQISLITLLISISLYFLDVKYAVIIGFVAGLMNLIPYFGPIIGMFIGILIGMTSGLETQTIFELWPLALKIVAVFLGVQLLDNIVFQPIIFSSSIEAHPLEIFLVISIMGTLAGISGLIVAIPLYTLIKVVAKEFLSKYQFVQSLTKNI